ncbi:MAG: hypothetical protein ACKO6N_27870, partial [Myxococcota bacterium]
LRGQRPLSLKGHKNQTRVKGWHPLQESLKGQRPFSSKSRFPRGFSFLLKGLCPFKLSQQGAADPCTPFCYWVRFFMKV